MMMVLHDHQFSNVQTSVATCAADGHVRPLLHVSWQLFIAHMSKYCLLELHKLRRDARRIRFWGSGFSLGRSRVFNADSVITCADSSLREATCQILQGWVESGMGSRLG